MNHSNNDDGDYNNMEAGEDDPTPFPPATSCIAAMGIVLLLMLMCFIFTLLTFAVFIFCLVTINLIEYWFRGDNLEMEDMEDFDLEDDAKAVRFLEAFLRAAKGKEERGRKKSKKKKEEWKNDVEGSIECFRSEEVAELGYRECSICMDEFKKGDKYLVFPGCGHIFHCKCIARWLSKEKLTCPVCRSCVNASNANGTRGFRRSSWAQP